MLDIELKVRSVSKLVLVATLLRGTCSLSVPGEAGEGIYRNSISRGRHVRYDAHNKAPDGFTDFYFTNHQNDAEPKTNENSHVIHKNKRSVLDERNMKNEKQNIVKDFRYFLVNLSDVEKSSSMMSLSQLKSENTIDRISSDRNGTAATMGITFSKPSASATTEAAVDTNETDSSFPFYIRIWASVALILVALVGTIGNMLVPLLVCLNKDLRHSTNLFLLNLAAADLLVLLVCLPTAMIELHVQPGTWVLGPVMCWVVPLVEVLVTRASVLTLVVISFERYLAICRPLRTAAICSKPRAATVCGCLWALALVSSIPTVLATQFTETVGTDGSPVEVCLTGLHHRWVTHYYLLSAVTFVMFPFMFLLVVYALIATKLLVQRRNTHSRHATLQQWRAKKQVAVMLGAVVVVFFLCLLPFQVLTVWIILSSEEDIRNLSDEAYYNILYFCRVMLYINSAANPVIYNVMSSKFRNALHKLFRRDPQKHEGRKRKSLSGPSTTNTTLSSGSFNTLRRRASEVFGRRLSKKLETKPTRNEEPQSEKKKKVIDVEIKGRLKMDSNESSRLIIVQPERRTYIDTAQSIALLNAGRVSGGKLLNTEDEEVNGSKEEHSYEYFHKSVHCRREEHPDLSSNELGLLVDQRNEILSNLGESDRAQSSQTDKNFRRDVEFKTLDDGIDTKSQFQTKDKNVSLDLGGAFINSTTNDSPLALPNDPSVVQEGTSSEISSKSSPIISKKIISTCNKEKENEIEQSDHRKHINKNVSFQDIEVL